MNRTLSTILAADIAGFSRLVGADEEGALAALRRIRAEVIDPLLETHKGRVANTAGDSLLIEFPSAVEAVRFAVAMQRDIAAQNAGVAADKRLEFRIGVNVGDVTRDGDDLLGDGVNIAARLEALAPPGGIILSRSTRDQVRDRLDLNLADLGEVTVKNIARPQRAFQVLREGETPVRPPAPGRARTRKRGIAAIAAAALLSGGLFFLNARQPDFEPVSPASMAYALPQKPSIVVLPFKSLAAGDDQAWIADGLTESIISTLSLSPRMVVMSRRASFAYKDRDVDARDAAKELGVRYVLSGAVQNHGAQLRVTAELADAVEGRLVWSLREDGPTEDLFAVQDKISEKLFSEMQVSLTLGEGARDMRALAGSFEVWKKIVRGRAEFNKFTPEGNAAAEKIYRAAQKSYPDNALPYFFLGWVHWQKITLGISKDNRAEMVEARRMAAKALSIKDFGIGYALAAMLDLYSRDHENALLDADKALELAPGDGQTMPLIGIVKAGSGEPEEGAELLLRGMRFQPHFSGWAPIELARAYMMLGEFDKAKKYLNAVKGAEVNDQRALPNAYLGLAAIAVWEGRLDDARAAAKERLALKPKTTTASVKKALFFLKDQDYVTRYVDALRVAGIPDPAE